MARPEPWEVDDELWVVMLWVVIEPLLPKAERRVRHPGRRRHPDRPVFQGILLSCTLGSPGSTCRRNSASARA